MFRITIQKFIFPALLLAVFIISNQSLQSLSIKRQRLSQNPHGIWSLPPRALEAVAGEFKGIVSDYLTLEIGARLGTYVIRDGNSFKSLSTDHDWKNILVLFKASQTMDPAFFQTFQLAEGFLPWPPANLVYETQQFLQITADHRFWDWQPYRSMAFNCYFFLKNNEKASYYFLKASKVKNAPSFLAIVGTRLALKKGDIDLALEMVNSMLSNFPEDGFGYQDLVTRRIALDGAKVLQDAINEYKSRQGVPPGKFEDLLTVGILDKIPENPYHTDYCLSKSGRVFIDKLNCDSQ